MHSYLDPLNHTVISVQVFSICGVSFDRRFWTTSRDGDLLLLDCSKEGKVVLGGPRTVGFHQSGLFWTFGLCTKLEGGQR